MGNWVRVRAVIVHETRRINEPRLRWTVHADPAHFSGVANSSKRTATPVANKLQIAKRGRLHKKTSRQPSNCVQRLHVRRSGPSPPFESRKGGAAERGSGGCGAPLRASTRRPTGIDRFAPPRCVVRPQAYSLAHLFSCLSRPRGRRRDGCGRRAESDPINSAAP